MKLLVDKSISPKTAEFLEKQGHDIKSVRDNNLDANDKEVVELALKEDRAIITLDDDFGEIYYFSNEEKYGLFILREKPNKKTNMNSLFLIH